MEPPVLAGPIEFSPAEIAAIIAVLAGLVVVLTAPGWGLVADAGHWASAPHPEPREPGDPAAGEGWGR